MKILITGSAGMVGSCLMKSFSSFPADFEVIGLSRSDVDLTSNSAVLEQLMHFRPDLVIHAAAMVGGIQANIDKPLDFLARNLEIDRNVILGSLSLCIPKLIYIGSSCMYPKDYRQPLQESDLLMGKLEPTNEGYAIAKIVGSKLCEFASKSKGVVYRTIIPSNLYGPGDNFDPTSSHLLASIIRKVHEAKLTGSKSIEVWGTGKARREFTYVDDLGKWLANAVKEIERFPQYLNIGLGKDYSVDEFYSIASEVIGVKAELRHDLTKPDGMHRKLLDSSLAQRTMDWNPKTDIADGVNSTYQWYLREIDN